MTYDCPWPSRAARLSQLYEGLAEHDANVMKLSGIQIDVRRHCLACQIVASERHFDFDRVRAQRLPHPSRVDPASPLFDPIRGAVYYHQQGNTDEALWLVFLATHFGEHRIHGWRRVRDIYGALGKHPWTWERVTTKLNEFRDWLDTHHHQIGGAFSNHRKYESLGGWSQPGTGAVVASLVQWTEPHQSIARAFAERVRDAGNDRGVIFEALYNGFTIRRFGRLGRFDFLGLLGRIELIPARPSRPYLNGATGPKSGAQLLLGSDYNVKQMEDILIALGADLAIDMDTMEDALCNWQKNPDIFIHFTG